MAFYVYVSVAQNDRIVVFAMDPETGHLDRRGSVEVPGHPAPLAADPARKQLYVGRRGAREISSYRIDAATGGLSVSGSVPLESDPCFLATDRSGRFLFSAYYGAGNVAIHSLDTEGTVDGPPLLWLDTAPGAHAMQTDRTNSFAFVPHIAGDHGPNAIFQFRFDESTGALTPNSPARVVPDEQVGPRHFCFHPAQDILYFSNEQGSSVTAYRLDPASGTLSAFQTISTLPDGHVGSNTCAQIQISPSGRFLYAPNRGHNSIACFRVEGSSGRLTSIGHVPTEAIPRAFSLDPNGDFLFAAGLESGRLASYRIDGETGELSPLEVYDVGEEPMWVLAIGPVG